MQQGSILYSSNRYFIKYLLVTVRKIGVNALFLKLYPLKIFEPVFQLTYTNSLTS